jgi:hypothetical protein
MNPGPARKQLEAQSAKPAVREIEVHLLAKPPLRPDAVAIANEQHADHQLGINRGPPSMAVERRELVTQAAQIESGVNFPQ